jgi:hypothetical protein
MHQRHVELDGHDVLLAENLPCESYLDTGNRDSFANTPVTRLNASIGRGAVEAWARDACAPLVEHGPTVRALRARLACRIRALGLAAPRTRDVRISATGVIRARVSARREALRLVSPATRLAGDARLLGALVTSIVLDAAPIPLDGDAWFRRGFHPTEHHDGSAVRWTSGDAMLAIGRSNRARELEITVAALSSPVRIAA